MGFDLIESLTPLIAFIAAVANLIAVLIELWLAIKGKRSGDE